MLFAFDPEREAIFLVAGDKARRWEVVRAYVDALGGTLELVATLGDRSWKVA